MSFSKLLQLLRKERNLSQEELADKVFLTPQAISNYERGITEPSFNIIKELSKILNFKFIINDGNLIVLDKEIENMGLNNVKISVDKYFINDMIYYKGNSIFFDNNEVFASLYDEENNATFELMARGEIKIYDKKDIITEYPEYQDDEAREYLRDIYDRYGYKYIEENIIIENNNWWEIMFTLNDGYSDGVVVDFDEDIISETQVSTLLLEVKKEILSK